ncbi:MAG TPA: hypothetical protein VJ691_15510 [Vicinamibacterales bacterium]|nr:hypothetical protein [Vicinamibacterales bacterium]
MNNWKVWRLVVLLVLLGVFGWTLYTRGVPGRFGGVPAALETSYKTEHEWAIRETALDIEEMAAFANRREPRVLSSSLPTTPWEPDAFMPLAASAFGDAVAISAVDRDEADFYPALTALDPPTLVEASKTVSQMLAANIRNPRAHESAALVIGAFALREAADQLTDVRWAMNRMTAHLAAARTLRSDAHVSGDGRLANIVLLMLANHQARAMAQLETIGAGAPPLNAWVRSLRMRITRDWRLVAAPAQATRLEKLEYFRARRLAVRRRAGEHLATVNEPVAADFARIMQDTGLSVEDGHQFVTPALELELDEAAAVYQRMHGRPMPQPLSEALNHRATRLISGEPQVLPWGAWAQFFQRHIGMNVGMVDSFLRHTLGNADGANAARRQLDASLGELTLFPLGTLRRTKGTYGSEADLAYLGEIIKLTAQAPELVAIRAWEFAEMGSRYEPVPTLMPKRADWFRAPTPDVPFEAGVRQSEGFMVLPENAVAILDAAPQDFLLLAWLAGRGADEPGTKHARDLLTHSHDYDLRALESSMARLADDKARMPLREKACEISSLECITLGSAQLHYLEDEAAAAAAYERAFADPSLDAVVRANGAHWLVMYYERNGQTSKAIALADEGASTAAAQGYRTRARLYERLRDFDRAEQDLLTNYRHYDDVEGLLPFYYRRVEVEKNLAYQARWEKWKAEIFPNGMQPEPASLAGVPKTGVFINDDSEFSRRAGIRTGDIVVGLEGWRVDSVPQYRAINAFYDDDPTVRLTISRGGQLIKIEAKSPTRLFGTEIQTHPMKGWIQ